MYCSATQKYIELLTGLNPKECDRAIDLIKRIDPSLFLVGFKFEPSAIKETIIKGAVQLIRRAKLDLAVANTMRGNRYRAYILNSRWAYGPLLSKKEMVKKLIGLLGEQS